MVHKRSLVGKDIITPDGYGEVVEDLGTQILVEFPNKRRKLYSKADLK